jgi:hypothetical protein
MTPARHLSPFLCASYALACVPLAGLRPTLRLPTLRLHLKLPPSTAALSAALTLLFLAAPAPLPAAPENKDALLQARQELAAAYRKEEEARRAGQPFTASPALIALQERVDTLAAQAGDPAAIKKVELREASARLRATLPPASGTAPDPRLTLEALLKLLPPLFASDYEARSLHGAITETGQKEPFDRISSQAYPLGTRSAVLLRVIYAYGSYSEWLLVFSADHRLLRVLPLPLE